MEEIRTKGVIIDTLDYKEYDKLITIFTFDYGVIKAVIKGVKKPTAKIRFAGQLLCFADFILSKRGDRYTVINADLVESFYEIAYNYDKFLLAVDFIKIVKFVNKYNPDSSELFVVFIAILNILLKTNTDNNIVYAKFLVETLKALGYEHNFAMCEKCESVKDIYYFDKANGSILCESCAKDYSIKLSKYTLNMLNKIATTDFVDLEEITMENESGIDILKILQIIFKSNCA